MSNMNETGEKSFESELGIAIIGMAGRFPGAKNIHEFWNNIKNGIESISFFNDGELEESGIGRGILENPGYVRAKGMLAETEYFDAYFFGYSPGDAQMMDPQMRIYHECAWTALEDAGYVPGLFAGRIGIYSGASLNLSWQVLTLLSGSQSSPEIYSLTQLNNKDFLSSRIAYKLNLKGPAVSVQTACSTSLVAIHQAVQGLLNYECEMALAGGVTLSYPQKAGYMYQNGMINSPDGHCRAFDRASAGTVSGNGVGIVVLKHLDQAVEDGDQIYAVIKGTAINNDGIRKAGFTAPSVEGQAEAISAARFMAEVEPESIGYIETHGTGTPLGDPVEIEALKLAFNSDKKKFCAI